MAEQKTVAKFRAKVSSNNSLGVINIDNLSTNRL